jgi:hypothetical protein
VADEITQAIQIIRLAIDGVNIALKTGKGGLGALKKMAQVIAKLVAYEKSVGKTSMRKLLLKGGDLQVFQFKTKDMKQVKKLAKKYGIVYSVLPDVNKTDGLSEIIFHSEAVPRINALIQKLNNGKISSFADYLQTENGQKLEEVLDKGLKEAGIDAEKPVPETKSEKEVEMQPISEKDKRELVKRIDKAASKNDDPRVTAASKKTEKAVSEKVKNMNAPSKVSKQAAERRR